MKNLIYLLIVVLALIITNVCCSHNGSDNPSGGWYLINENNEIIDGMIFSKYDVDQIWIDSSLVDGRNIYVVTGGFTPDARTKLASFTEHNIGKRFGFVLDNKVITSDIITQKDDKGQFSILFTHQSDALRAYKSLLIDALNSKE